MSIAIDAAGRSIYNRLFSFDLSKLYLLMPRRHRFRINMPLWSAITLFILGIAAYVGWGVLAMWLAPKRLGVPDTLFLVFVAKCLDVTLAVWFFAVGASIGSFLNVVAYRLPLGKTLGGHSACPFCATPIRSSDNIPVLAWLKLRGRCRTCRLPISIQYPLVELVVGLLFLSIYFSEFGLAGSNLPGTPGRPAGLGLIWMSVTRLLMARVLLYAYLLSGLIAAALMILRGARPPATLYLWLAWPLCLAPALEPSVLVVPWHGRLAATITHVDVVLTLACGLVGALITSALTLPLFAITHNQRSADRASPAHDDREHAVAWVGTNLCLGWLLGWQAVPAVASLTLLCTWAWGILSWRLLPALGLNAQAANCQPVVWAGLGLLLFRANWKSIHYGLNHLPLLPEWCTPIVPALMALLLAAAVGHLRRSGPGSAVNGSVCDLEERGVSSE